MVAAGIISLSFGKGRAGVSTILFALATGAIIAGYATVDAIGVRIAQHTGAYTAWVLVLYGALLPTTFIVARGKLAVHVRSPETWKALAGGIVAVMAYAVVVATIAILLYIWWAFRGVQKQFAAIWNGRSHVC